MGISGLLPLLKSIMLPVHIKDLNGCSVAIDTYSWLHKGALSCSKDLCKGLPTSKHIDYCMHRVKMLRHHGVKPILVFDGGLLPMKSDQENKRARSRKENLSRAMEHESNGNSTAAYECFQKAVDISPSIAYDLIQVLKREDIPYVVAPYEADAQMTYLAVSKQVDAVITEDSDLIAFGCPRIIYKMDKFGQGVEFDASKLEQNRDLSLTGFTKQMFLEMCILSGCDYLQSLPGMGLKKAHALIKKFKSYDKVLKHLKFNGIVVSPLYEESFKKAIFTFQHQRVYDPVSEEIVHLFELPNGLDGDLDFLGPPISQDVAKGIASGDLDPLTKVPCKGSCDGDDVAEVGSYQLMNFKPDSAKKKLELPAQKNLLTNYFCFASPEAKREYKVPRVSPTIQKSDHGVLNIKSYAYVQSDPGVKMSSTTVTGLVLTRAESKAQVKSQTNGVYEVAGREGGTTDKVVQHPIYRPCTALRKKQTSDPDQSKVRPERTNTTSRSKYFLHTTTNVLNEIQEKNTISTDADFRSATYATGPVSVDSDEKTSTAIKKVVVSSYFLGKTMQGKIQYGKNENQVDENVAPHNNLSLLDESEGMSATHEDNATGRNLFGPEILVDKENFAVKDGKYFDLDKYAFSRIPSSDNHLEEARKRRKVAYIDNPKVEDCRGNEFSTGCDAACEAKGEEEKFGCNISHIGQYSEIAEKSLEKFVSVISSFKFKSNGSRASGLRPPLKDVKNTCNNRLSSNKDLSEFAYVPIKKSLKTSRRV